MVAGLAYPVFEWPWLPLPGLILAAIFARLGEICAKVVFDRAAQMDDAQRRMKTLLALTLAFLLCSCAKSPSGIAGEWKLQLGKSVQTLQIVDRGGKISGIVEIDKAWGGAVVSLTGMRVGKRVEIRYENSSSNPDLPSIYCFKGNLTSADQMSGTCDVIGVADGLLWMAQRSSRKE
jgi:hypothetical protein